MDDRDVAGRMQGFAKHIESEIPEDSLFILMIVPSGTTDGRTHYVSNAQRPDVVKTLREYADALERGAVAGESPMDTN